MKIEYMAPALTGYWGTPVAQRRSSNIKTAMIASRAFPSFGMDIIKLSLRPSKHGSLPELQRA